MHAFQNVYAQVKIFFFISLFIEKLLLCRLIVYILLAESIFNDYTYTLLLINRGILIGVSVFFALRLST